MNSCDFEILCNISLFFSKLKQENAAAESSQSAKAARVSCTKIARRCYRIYHLPHSIAIPAIYSCISYIQINAYIIYRKSENKGAMHYSPRFDVCCGKYLYIKENNTREIYIGSPLQARGEFRGHVYANCSSGRRLFGRKCF